MRLTVIRVFLISAIMLQVAANCELNSPRDAVITIQRDQRFQTITGWEAVAQAGQDESPAFEQYAARLFDLAVNELGLTRLRVEIPSGIENPTNFYAAFKAGQMSESQLRDKRYEVINDNGDPENADPAGFQFDGLDSTIEKVVLPMRELLAKRGEPLFVNVTFVDFQVGRGESNIRHNDNPAEYAELMFAVFQHINEKYGIVPDAIEVILEPDNDTGWTGEQIGRAVVSTARRLSERGFKTRFIVPSTTNAANAPVYIDQIATVPGAMTHVSEFSYHRYCCATEGVLRQIVDRAEKFGKQTAMLEWIGADHQTLHEDLKKGNNSAWEQYSLVGLIGWGPDRGESLLLVDDRDITDPKVTYSRRAPFLRQYFSYVRPGAQRIGAQSSNEQMDPVAFINKDGGYALVVKATDAGMLTIQGLPHGIYGVSLATEREGNLVLSDQTVAEAESCELQMPAAGVLTVFTKKNLN